MRCHRQASGVGDEVAEFPEQRDCFILTSPPQTSNSCLQPARLRFTWPFLSFRTVMTWPCFFGDSAFPLALAAMEHHSKALQRLQAARMANEVLSKAPMSLGAYWEQAQKSEAAHNELVLRLKREYLQAHPELLQEHSAP